MLEAIFVSIIASVCGLWLFSLLRQFIFLLTDNLLQNISSISKLISWISGIGSKVGPIIVAWFILLFGLLQLIHTVIFVLVIAGIDGGGNVPDENNSAWHVMVFGSICSALSIAIFNKIRTDHSYLNKISPISLANTINNGLNGGLTFSQWFSPIAKITLFVLNGTFLNLYRGAVGGNLRRVSLTLWIVLSGFYFLVFLLVSVMFISALI